MERKIQIDCANVKSVSTKLLGNAEEIKKISSEMQDIVNTIDNNWQGIDSKNFKDKAIGLCNNLNNEATYLEECSSFLSSTSDKYSSNINNIYSRLESTNNTLDDIKY